MFKKTLTGACGFLLLLNPLTATAATTLASTEDQTVATSENTQGSTQETAEGTTTSEMTVDSTTASGEGTSETTSSSEPTTSSSEAVTSSSVSETTTTDSSETTESTSEGAESTGETSTNESTEESTTGSSNEKNKKSETDSSNPHLIETYNPTTNPGPQVDVGSVDYFRENVVDTYPLGIGTRFTAFAGKNLSFSGDGNNLNYDGTYAAKNINLKHYVVNYYRHSDQYPSSNDWNYPFSYEYSTDTTSTAKAPLVFIGDTYNTTAPYQNNTYNPDGTGDKTEAMRALTTVTNFGDQQSFLFETDSGIVEGVKNDSATKNRTTVSGKVGDIQDFRTNLGVNDDASLFTAAEYFDNSRKQLKTVSDFYKSFTANVSAVGNSRIDSTIEPAKYEVKANGINEINVEVPQMPSGSDSENGVAIFDLSSEVLGEIRENNTMRIKLDNVTAKTEKKDLPFIIFNWNDWKKLNWVYQSGNMIFVDSDDNSLGDDFYKKMGSHIIHNFPDVASGSTLDLGVGTAESPFAGTILVPNGSIYLDSSNASTESFWGSLIAGENIRLSTTITKEKAFGSIFDAENLPDFNETTLKLTFTDDKVTSSENKAQNTLNIYGDQNEYTVEFTRKDQVDPTKELPVNVMADESQGDASSSLTGLAPQKDIPFTVDTTGWEPGTYTITGTVTDKNGQSTTAEFTIVVQGILSLDAVPNLNFGTFKLGTIGNGSINHIQNFKVETGNSSEANQDGLIKITDSRNGGEGGNWSLNVTMTPFSREGEDDSVNAILNLNVQQDIDQAKIISLKIKSDELQTGDRLNHLGNDQETTNETFNILTDEENSSTLEIADSITNLGTYQSTLTWTLSDLPKSDEISDN